MHRFRLMLPLLLPAVFAVGVSATGTERKVVEIGTARGVAGQTVRGSLKVAEAADGSPVALPIAIVTGRQAGPVVWVEASAHGDEYGGPRALQDVVRNLDPQAMTGTVVAVMITNPLAFRALQRVNPNLDDLADFGDAFPGRDRFATERIAAAVSAEVRRVAEYFVDMHTGGDRFRQHPFVFYSV
ncbi:MAG: succinylglutamate desuccinylase/aspartoacylase family protein, partial [Thermoanaerobaculia bacterium]